MDNRTRTAWIFSIIAAGFFFLTTIFSIITTVEISSAADLCNKEYFYENADTERYYSAYAYSNYYNNYHYDFYNDYTNTKYGYNGNVYEDYEHYREVSEYAKEYLPYSVVLTLTFVAYTAGSFFSKKKSCHLLFLIAQAVSLVSSIIFFASLFECERWDYSDLSYVFIAVYIIFGLGYIAYNLLLYIDKIKGKSILAKLFAIPMLFNAAAIAFLVLVLNIEFNKRTEISPVFIIEIVMLAHAFIFYYISASIRHNTYKRRPKPVPPVAVAQPVKQAAPQPVMYTVPPQPVVYTVPVVTAPPVAQPQPTQPVKHTSATEEIKQYKELLDIGAITQEEFEAKKKQLLGL